MTVLDWLMESDPSLRWQVMRDLGDEHADAVAVERARVAEEGWGARLLELQGSDGQWGDGPLSPDWTGTTYTMLMLRDMGLEPESPRAHRAVGLVRDNVVWDYAGEPFFSGEVEPCVNGMAMTIGGYFGEDVGDIAKRLLGEQLADGGWNCEAENGSTRSSFHSTICVLEGLLEHERATGGQNVVTEARLRGEDYLMDRAMFRRQSTGELIEPEWTQFSYPAGWHYDVLRGLDHLRHAGAVPDKRIADAIELVESKRDGNGRWLLEKAYPGEVHFDMDEGPGKPSRWNTLRAMRVLRWYHE
jgi:hypothetical protein